MSDTSKSSGLSPRIRWFWKDDNGWKKYSQKDSDIIEKAYETGTNTVNVVNGQYKISIKDRLQTKIQTSFKRNILRGSWFWVEGSEKLEPYSEDAAATLEMAFQSQQWGTKIDIGGSYYVKLNSDLISHRQHRHHGGNPAGRRVQRGYKGRLGNSNATKKQIRLIVKPNHNTNNLKSRMITVCTKGDVLAQVKLQINLKFGESVASISSFISDGVGLITTSNHILALPEDSVICYVLNTDPPLPSKPTSTPTPTKKTEATPSRGSTVDGGSTDSIDFTTLSYTELVCFIKATEEMLAQAKAEKEKRDKSNKT
eukprot:TRINITY_DN1917_c0_g1_i1.p1 TRINITY_DN1917_c0_g1~~TRINITY_DN1917_c0_g1_i1.p1  ORF type:complete len:312 (+),score=58.39 TRINITY_DN1917_c0_g1_i1:57-992(+)